MSTFAGGTTRDEGQGHPPGLGPDITRTGARPLDHGLVPLDILPWVSA